MYFINLTLLSLPYPCLRQAFSASSASHLSSASFAMRSCSARYCSFSWPASFFLLLSFLFSPYMQLFCFSPQLVFLFFDFRSHSSPSLLPFPSFAFFHLTLGTSFTFLVLPSGSTSDQIISISFDFLLQVVIYDLQFVWILAGLRLKYSGSTIFQISSGVFSERSTRWDE